MWLVDIYAARIQGFHTQTLPAFKASIFGKWNEYLAALISTDICIVGAVTL